LALGYAVVPILTLLFAHYLIVMKLDLNTSYLLVFALAFPALVGFALVWHAGRGLETTVLLGMTIGIVSVFGMLVIVGLIDSVSIFPPRGSNGRKQSNTPPALPSRRSREERSPASSAWRGRPCAAAEPLNPL
jgi:hypothetical protein